MDECKKYTITQIKEKMDNFRDIFSEVRLLTKEQIAGICEMEHIDKLNCPCYSFWNKDHPCENCVSAKAFLYRHDETKLEYIGDEVYHVIAHYVEVDGEPCVIELIRRFGEDEFLDMVNDKNHLTNIDHFFSKTYTDVMTGAYNRRFYEEKFKKSVMTAGVAMIDLDDFKVYNDIYGHLAGDIVVTAFVKKLKENIRSSDRIIRYGGDEFLLIMPGIHEKSFESTLKQILQEVGDIVLTGYENIKITSSIGATLCDNEQLEVAVKRADRLMYKAKLHKNVVITDKDRKIVESSQKSTILIVDDSEINRELLSAILNNEFNIIEASGGKECIDMLNRYGTELSVVLLDIMMPDIDGFGVLKYMTEHHLIEEIPVITITGDESGNTIRKAYEMGISDFINRPFDAKVVYRRVLNTINLYEKQRRLISTVSNEILEKEKSSKILVEILSHVAEFRSGMGEEHVTNINKLTELILLRLLEKTNKYALTEKDVYLITTASSLHDIGKVGIDSSILDKPGKLSAEEFEKVKEHTVIGADIIMKVKQYCDEPLARYARDICLYHHEKYDGKGYPEGLLGDDIPIAAQVVSLADVYDALTAKRVYKEAFTTDEALEMISDGKCGAFNPLLLECLFDIKKYLTKDKNGIIQ